jgi:hypothetical protein
MELKFFRNSQILFKQGAKNISMLNRILAKYKKTKTTRYKTKIEDPNSYILTLNHVILSPIIKLYNKIL